MYFTPMTISRQTNVINVEYVSKDHYQIIDLSLHVDVKEVFNILINNALRNGYRKAYRKKLIKLNANFVNKLLFSA